VHVGAQFPCCTSALLVSTCTKVQILTQKLAQVRLSAIEWTLILGEMCPTLHRGTEFTGFTSTKVRILTQMALLDREFANAASNESATAAAGTGTHWNAAAQLKRQRTGPQFTCFARTTVEILTHMYIYIHLCVCVCVCVCVCIYIYEYLYIYVYMYKYMHIYTYIYTYSCIYIYTHTHTCSGIYAAGVWCGYDWGRRGGGWQGSVDTGGV
jgi:hypothetical protein